jgi:hypothetical protein
VVFFTISLMNSLIFDPFSASITIIQLFVPFLWLFKKLLICDSYIIIKIIDHELPIRPEVVPRPDGLRLPL